MGLLRFISKKTASRGRAGASVGCAQPLESSSSQTLYLQDESGVAVYDSKVGGYLSDVPVGFHQSELSLDAATEDERLAPIPNVPRSREVDTEEGLGMTEGDHHSTMSLPREGPRAKRSGQRRPPPLSFRMTKTESAASTSCPSTPASSMSTIGGVFNSRDPGHSRAEALRVNNNGKAFKDLLDAHSEIRPADSKARVTASGARNYGEDVADRNMGQNGFDLSSEHVRAFYAQTRMAESQRAGHLNGTKKLDPYKAGVRRLTPSTSQPLLPGDACGGVSLSNSKPSRKEDSVLRRSVSTYMPLSLGKLKSLPFDRKHEHPNSPLSPRTPASEGESSGFGLSAPKSNVPVEPQIPDAAAPSPTIRTARRPRDSVEIAKQRAEAPMSEDGDDDYYSSTGHFALWSDPRSGRSSVVISASSSSKKHQSLHTLHSSAQSKGGREAQRSPASFPPEISPKGMTHVATGNPLPKTPVRSEFDKDQNAAISPKSQARWPREDGQACPQRKPHLLATKEDSRTTGIPLPDDDALDYPPLLSPNSIRKLSASSGAPTACESSTVASIVTSTFNRPPSLHTADTSVDLSIHTASPSLKPTTPRSPNHCWDSDAESLMRSPTSIMAGTASKRQQTEGGEDGELLFKDDRGFGPDGMQLPGLADPLPLSPAPGQKEDSTGRRSAKRAEGSRRREVRRLSAFGLGGTCNESPSECKGGSNGGYGDRQRERRKMEAADDDGYDADYIDEDEEVPRRRPQGAKQTRRQRLEGCEKETNAHKNDQDGKENQPEQNQTGEEAEAQGRIMNAAMLRKQARRAKIMAGQPSAAMMRRKGPTTNQELAKRPSVPSLKIEGEV